jgi:hypothetical protein
MTNKKLQKLRRKEERLAREATRAVERLQKFRQKHQRAVERDDIIDTVRINGWMAKSTAGRIATRLMNAGVGAWQARLMFYDADQRRQ